MSRTTRLIAVLVGLCLPMAFRIQADDGIHVLVRSEGGRVRSSYVPGQVVVQLQNVSGDETSVAEGAIRRVGGIRARRSTFGPRYLVTLDQGMDVPEAVRSLQSMPGVAYAELNGTVRATFSPNDPFFSFQWHMKMLGAERIWDIQRGDPSVVVAVLDTGIAYEDFGPFRKAPDWGGTVFVQGFNVFTRTQHANDDNFHGTHVASTVAEATNNGVGVAGLAFGCALMPVKVLDSDGNGTYFDVAEGVDYAVNFTQNGAKPVKVINMSLGGDGSSETLSRAIDRAISAGVVVVAAAGNDNMPTVSFPASHPSVIAVGAVDARKERAPYSNYGPRIDVVAPGGNINRDDDGDGKPDGVLQQTFNPRTAKDQGRYDDFAYFFVDGTSQATPHVSAMAALLVRQGITDPAAVKASITSTAEDLGPPGKDDIFGYGLIRPTVALKGLGLNQ